MIMRMALALNAFANLLAVLMLANANFALALEDSVNNVTTDNCEKVCE